LFGIIAGLVIGVTGLLVAGIAFLSVIMGWRSSGGNDAIIFRIQHFVYGTRQRRVEREQKYLASKQIQR
jgi:hypothetical protein